MGDEPPREAAIAASPLRTAVDDDDADARVLPPAPRLFFYITASAALVIAALYFGRAVLMPFALAAFLAFVLDPLVTRLRRIGVPMALAVTLVVSMTLTLLGGLAALGAQQLVTLSRDLPTYQTTIEKKLRALRPAPDGSNVLSGASRLKTVIENEINAARSALEPRSTSGARAPTRVLVEPAPPSPLRALGDMVSPLMVPLAMAGLVIVLLAYMLAQRREISDRLIRLVGGDLHRMAEALNDAARRVSRYLVAQLLVNIGYGIPLALGLWLIGVPGALLWGALAALLRFVPYLGPLLAAVFPLLLAFAVDPGWSMVVWTGTLILVLELVVNNVVEPIAYSDSTGVSPVAVLLSAAFWVLVWGPMGLVLATPLTVCLVVLGRHLGALRFLDVMLGNEPAFDPPTQLYRRLISGDLEEAIALAGDEAERASLRSFYSETGVPMLGLAAAWAARGASAKQRHRVLSGVAQIVEALREDHAGAEAAAPRVLCVGARSEFDTLSAAMLAHALAHDGVAAQSLPAAAIGVERISALSLEGADALVLCSFQSQPQTHARFVCKQLRRRHPELRIVLAAWAALPGAIASDALAAIGADALALTLAEAAARAAPADSATLAAPPAAETAAEDTGVVDMPQQQLARAAQHAVEVFRVPLATVCWRRPDGSWLQASGGRAAATVEAGSPAAPGTPWAQVLADASPLTVADLARAPTWADAVPAALEALPAFAGVPLLDASQQAAGVLAVHDAQAREFSADEIELLARIGQTLGTELAALPPAAWQAEAEGRSAAADNAASAPSYPGAAQRPAYAGTASA
jgi:predicted PurR-regulated permease PerM/methylmalonyl-CoA mutase cobalamin-binding subunit